MKNAYEIRLEVLQMAHGDEFNRFHMKVDSLRDSKDRLPDQTIIDSLVPKTADIINRAEELYKFVEDKGN